MPYAVKKTDGYGVQNTATGKWKSRHTSKANAEAQRRLLYGVEHGFKPTGKKGRWGRRKLKKRSRKGKK